jgi:DNA-binding HxlR family transcriptional regulator
VINTLFRKYSNRISQRLSVKDSQEKEYDRAKPKPDDDAVATKEQEPEDLAEVRRLISDSKSLLIFNTIFRGAGDNSCIYRTHLELSKKEYYTRLSRLIKAGLVKKEKGRYYLTAFGKVIYNAHVDLETKIENALKIYWRLKVVDSMNVPCREEHDTIISTLIENQEIKALLLES